jgi:hypothetical protein
MSGEPFFPGGYTLFISAPALSGGLLVDGRRPGTRHRGVGRGASHDPRAGRRLRPRGRACVRRAWCARRTARSDTSGAHRCRTITRSQRTSSLQSRPRERPRSTNPWQNSTSSHSPMLNVSSCSRQSRKGQEQPAPPPPHPVEGGYRSGRTGMDRYQDRRGGRGEPVHGGTATKTCGD